MSPLQNLGDATGLSQSGSGKFFNPNRDLSLGETWNVEWTDIAENTNTKYPIKDKSYCYRITFKDPQGQDRLWDVSGKDVIRQAFRVLYPDGLDQPIKPGLGTLHRRTERSTKRASVDLVRTGDVEKVAF